MHISKLLVVSSLSILPLIQSSFLLNNASGPIRAIRPSIILAKRAFAACHSLDSGITHVSITIPRAPLSVAYAISLSHISEPSHTT